MNTSKKVVFLTYIPSPYRINFFNELAKKVDLKVIFYKKSIENYAWPNEGKQLQFEHTYLFEKSKTQLLFRLYKQLRASKDDILIVGGYYLLPEICTILYCKLINRKFVLNSDGGFITNGFLLTKIKKLLIQSASYCLSSGKNTSNTLKFYGVKQENIFEYHFTTVFESELAGKTIFQIEKSKLKGELNLDHNFAYMVFVGQLIHRKGVDILLEALKLGVNKNIKTLIIGSGDQEQQLKQLVLDYQLDDDKVIFLGKLSKKEVLKYMQASDFFVFPSREDVWGLVLNEALACGLPIISTKNVGAAYSLVEEGKNGYLINSDDAADLHGKINLISNGDLETMGINSLLKAKKFTVEQMVKDHLILFEFLNDKDIKFHRNKLNIIESIF